MSSSWSDWLPQNFYLGLGIFLLVLLLVIISKRFYESNATPMAIVKKGASLVRMSADAAYQAQDAQNPLVAFGKASQAKAYLNVAQALANDGELTSEAKIAIGELQAEVDAEEERSRRRLVQLCPQVQGTTRVSNMAGYGSGDAVQPKADQMFTPFK